MLTPPDLLLNVFTFPLLIALTHSSSSSSNFKTPCDAEKSAQSNFNTICAIEYLQKPYVCDIDQAFSRAEIDRIDRHAIRPWKFFHYCSCSEQKCKASQLIGGSNRTVDRRRVRGDRSVKSIDDRSIHERRRRNKQKTDGAKETDKAKTAKTQKPLIISVNVYKKLIYPKTKDLLTKLLPCSTHYLSKLITPTSAIPIDTDQQSQIDRYPLTEDQILDIYARLNEDRWRSSKCAPNLTILVFTDQTIGYEDRIDQSIDDGLTFELAQWRPRIHARVTRVKSNPGNQALIRKTQELLKEINADNSSTSTGAVKLERFLHKLAKWYSTYDVALAKNVSSETKNQRLRHQHSIPLWAAITFGVCSVLSVGAVLVGNFVTSSKLTRRSKNSAGPGAKRKWGAGFSGGMWASV